jgi:hypothetical protein
VESNRENDVWGKGRTVTIHHKRSTPRLVTRNFHTAEEDEFLWCSRKIKQWLKGTGAESAMQVIPDWPDDGSKRAVAVIAIELPQPLPEFLETWAGLLQALQSHGYWPEWRRELGNLWRESAPMSNTGRTPTDSTEDRD